MADLEIRNFLTLSTGHVTRQTASWLEEHADEHGGSYGNYGWFLYCTEENSGLPAIPDDLWAVMQFSRAHGCSYLLLDCDGETTDDLPTWNW